MFLAKIRFSMIASEFVRMNLNSKSNELIELFTIELIGYTIVWVKNVIFL